MICQQNPQYKIQRFKFHLGKKLEKGQHSSSKLYALVSQKNYVTLRISVIKETAELYCDDSSRCLYEAWLEK